MEPQISQGSDPAREAADKSREVNLCSAEQTAASATADCVDEFHLAPGDRRGCDFFVVLRPAEVTVQPSLEALHIETEDRCDV